MVTVDSASLITLKWLSRLLLETFIRSLCLAKAITPSDLDSPIPPKIVLRLLLLRGELIRRYDDEMRELNCEK